MSLHRFFVPFSVFEGEMPEKTFKLQGELVHQLNRVLRLPPGAKVLLLDGTGREYLAELTQFNKNGIIEGKVLEEQIAVGEPRTQITIFQALLKGEKFEYVLQKATEVGAKAFVPMLTERVIGGSSPAKLERWRKIVQEAAEQSRRGVVPEVAEPLSFGLALKQATQGGLALLAWEDEKTRSLRAALQNAPEPPRKLSLLIGPEGGLSQAEVEQARGLGVQTISLGPRILRAETAGPIATALILYEMGDI